MSKLLSIDNSVVVNACVESVTIGLDRDVFLSVWMFLEFDCGTQGFGGYVLGAIESAAAGNHKTQPNLAGEYLVRCMEACDVLSFEAMRGKTVRVHKEDAWSGKIHGIGHIIKDDRWFYPARTFAEWMGGDAP